MLIRLDEKQCLELDAADVSVDGRLMRVVIRAGGWHWTDYGGTERHHEELSPGSVEFHAPPQMTLTAANPDVRLCHPYSMEIRGVDPRDQTWEIDQPTYRVYFHDADGASTETEVADGDVGEVLAWAEAAKGSRTFVLYACAPRGGLGLLRLQGRDPNQP